MARRPARVASAIKTVRALAKFSSVAESCKKMFRRLLAGDGGRPDRTAKEAKMGKVISLGALVTIVVPQVAYCAFGGPVSPWVFVVSVQAGVIIGLVNYIRSPAAFVSLMDTKTEAISQDDSTKH